MDKKPTEERLLSIINEVDENKTRKIEHYKLFKMHERVNLMIKIMKRVWINV